MFSTEGGLQLQNNKTIELQGAFGISSWCFVKEKLYAWDYKTQKLLIYNAVSLS